ncbi:LPS export ABC transporter periplasmic protein LptC [Opitutales bacterium]|nr:LPS export ABC transporter periplasmic protein LptC [Opitutales bacterium]
MDKNDESPFKWVLGFAILVFLIGLPWVFLQKSTIFKVNHLDSNESFTLLINTSTGGKVFGGGEFTAGSKVSILAEPFTGYTFSGWEGSSTLEKSVSDTNFQIFSDMNITARFKEIDSELKLTGNKPMTIRDFEGFETSQYFKDSGKKMMTLKFASADVERPKVGFLRMGLAFLMVRNLEILLVADGLSANFIHKKIDELKKHKGVSYAVAEPVTFWFKGSTQSIKIVANKGKLTSEGTFRLWGGVKINKLQKSIILEKLEIKLSPNKEHINFVDLKSGQAIHQILLD